MFVLLRLLFLSLQQEDQPQSVEEESSEEPEDNAQTEPLCQDRKTSGHPEARSQGERSDRSGWKENEVQWLVSTLKFSSLICFL